ncbi:MAG TPA: hypothetical protein VM889_03645 [Candidatus Thermoplasmatota archaeon]|nr:hypothetical protein [Candidatus Thermoplasmatota archaeon]
MGRLSLVLAATALIVNVAGAAFAHNADLRWEAAERGPRFAHQSNNVVEAILDAGETPGGIRILDSFWTTSGPNRGDEIPPLEEAGDGQRRNAYGWTDSSQRTNMNTRRALGEDAPDVIWGAGWFHAWHGHWRDQNGDGIIRIRWANATTAYADNEWTRRHATIYTWMSPGSHPAYTASYAPDDASPDVSYITAGNHLYISGGGPVILYDNSLLQRYVAETVSDPIFLPHASGTPYTPRNTSLVDIDEYPVVAPGPVASLYGAAAAPLVNGLAPPIWPLCPQGCILPPVTAPEPLGGPVNAAQGRIYGRYMQETEIGSTSTASGRLAEYQTEHRGWIDLQLGFGQLNPFVNARTSPLPGRDADGRPAMLPGILGVQAWTGIWRDLNEDGYVGTASAPDPYESGARPIADDHRRSNGEFTGVYGSPAHETKPRTPSNGGLAGWNVTLTPTTDWGAGVLVTDKWYLPTSLGTSWIVTGSSPIRIPMSWTLAEPGNFWGMWYVHFPQGSTSVTFTACTDDLRVEFADAGLVIDSIVRDCDVVREAVLG